MYSEHKYEKIDCVKKRFVEEGLDVALNGETRNRIDAKKLMII